MNEQLKLSEKLKWCPDTRIGQVISPVRIKKTSSNSQPKLEEICLIRDEIEVEQNQFSPIIFDLNRRNTPGTALFLLQIAV